MRVAWVGVAVMAALLASGCASETRDAAVASVLSHVKNARNRIDRAKSDLEVALEKAEKADPKKIDMEDLKDALKEIKGLKDDAEKMQREKLRIDAMSPPTDEERADLAQRYQRAVAEALDGMQKARAELEQAVQRAEKLDPAAGAKIRNELTEAESGFATLARRR
ncbi:MAG: hypothetical protein NZO58_04815 [Gemmataceae bacterium]|nr:hypothetical protein [Gemmataceae bacterium]